MLSYMTIVNMHAQFERLKSEDPVVRHAFKEFPDPEQHEGALILALLMMENERNRHREALAKMTARAIAESQTKAGE